MSAKRDKQARQARRNRPKRDVNAAQLSEIARRVMAYEFVGLPESRVSQIAVGWMRAAFAEIGAIVHLSTNGLDFAAAPNRRSYAEIVLRLQWLHQLEVSLRGPALDSMIEDEKRLAASHVKNLEKMGVTKTPDFSELSAVVTETSTDSAIRVQAKTFTEAAVATVDAAGLYRAWREETQNTHATWNLALSYAPYASGEFGKGKPFVADPEFETLILTTFLVLSLTVRLLMEEGASKEVIDGLFDTFFSGVRAGL